MNLKDILLEITDEGPDIDLKQLRGDSTTIERHALNIWIMAEQIMDKYRKTHITNDMVKSREIPREYTLLGRIIGQSFGESQVTAENKGMTKEEHAQELAKAVNEFCPKLISDMENELMRKIQNLQKLEARMSKASKEIMLSKKRRSTKVDR